MFIKIPWCHKHVSYVYVQLQGSRKSQVYDIIALASEIEKASQQKVFANSNYNNCILLYCTLIVILTAGNRKSFC